MLRHLHIRNFAIVPQLEQDFSPGFTAISGETGAGKSILVDALGLLLGERSDSSWVKAGADRAELSAEFSVAGNREAAAFLADQDLADGDHCLLRRSIQANGRSRAWINGTPVTVQQLASLGGLLVELHGQNEHIRLTETARQLELLDETGDYQNELKDTAKAFRLWRAVQERYTTLEQTAAIPVNELEFLRYQLQELQQAVLSQESLGKLEREHRLLARAGEYCEALDKASTLIDTEETGLTARLSRVIDSLAAVRELDEKIGSAVDMLEEARINCQEALNVVQAAAQNVEISPERLAELEHRLSALNDLARKHQVGMGELQSVHDELAQRIETAESFREQRGRLEQELSDTVSAFHERAGRLSTAREKHARALSAAVGKLMGKLGMTGGSFAFRVSTDHDREPRELGVDRVAIEVSANPGIPPGPLARIASGGELSRISLAIKVACSSAGSGRLQVFDEVDAGIGGETAHAIGRLLQTLAAGGQALCVTHLAQVAACADQQLRVHKQAGAEATDVDTRELDADDRIEELARMLGGKVSEQSRAHATEMLLAAKPPLH